MKIEQNKSLADLTSFGVGGNAEFFAEISDSNQIDEVLNEVSEQTWMLGQGTNSLISDAGLPGLTLHINNQGIESSGNKVTAQAGTDWDELVQYSIEHNLWGLEFMSKIPGSVGAGVAGNIAAYGQAVADSLESIEVFDIFGRVRKTMFADELNLGYRSSIFNQNGNNHLIILSATFNLSNTPTKQLEYKSALKIAEQEGLDTNQLKSRREIIIKARQKAGSILDKNSAKTAGSFYKNPIVAPEVAEHVMSFDESGNSKSTLLKQNQIHGGSDVRVSAAHVLLASGFKRGQTWNQVQLHPEHVLKIVNLGGATAQEIYQVHLMIRATVKEKLGIDLENEVQFLGKF